MSLKEFNPAIKYGHLVATDEIEFDLGIPFTVSSTSCGSINLGGNAGNAAGIGGSTTIELLSDAAVIAYGTSAFNSARRVYLTSAAIMGPRNIWTGTNSLTNFWIQDNTGTTFFSTGSSFTGVMDSRVYSQPSADIASSYGSMAFGTGYFTGGTHNRGLRIAATGTCLAGNNFTVIVHGIIK
jgi:hypothetical protein